MSVATTTDQWLIHARKHVSRVIGNEVRTRCSTRNLRTTVRVIISEVELMVSTGALLVMRGYIPAGSRMEKCEMIELVAQACAETLELLHGQQNDVIYSRIVVAKICEVLWQQNRATLVAAGSFEVLNGSTLLVFSKGEYS